MVERDEGIRPDTTVEGLAKLRPAFTADGTVTAGNASQISDGARRGRRDERGARPTSWGWRRSREIVAYGMSADRFASLHTVPALALQKALKRAGLRRPATSDLVEINEAFAAVALHAARMLGVDEDIVNVNGGAVALGHPIGASGARHRADRSRYEMRRRGVELGGAAICGGGGQGDALILRRR